MTFNSTPLPIPFANPEQPAQDQRVKSVLQAIRFDPSQDIERLAGTVQLSKSRLSHLFKKETGSSLQDFLTDFRLNAAAGLLGRTNAPVKEVSYIVGYQHPPSFVRAFRNKFACTPNEYRQRQRVARIDS